MSSSRKGTYGDLDLQHILLFDKPSAENCIAVNNMKAGDGININFSFRDSVFLNDEVTFSAEGSAIKGGAIINYFWKINSEIVAKDTSVFTRKLTVEGKYNVELDVAVYTEADDNRKNYCVTKEIHVFHPKSVDVFYEPLVRKDENKLSIAGTADVSTIRLDSSKKDILNIKLEPVYFNTNKFDLRKDAVTAAKANINKMMVDAAIIDII